MYEVTEGAPQRQSPLEDINSDRYVLNQVTRPRDQLEGPHRLHMHVRMGIGNEVSCDGGKRVGWCPLYY